MKIEKITREEARKLAIKSQLLENTPKLSGKEGVLQAINHLGYIQIDTISVIARAHHHVLRSRVPDYSPGHLEQLEAKRAIFEYWAHAASYLPISAYRFSLYRKWEIGQGEGFWYKKNPERMAFVLDRIKAEGPLMLKDFKEGKKNLGTGKDWAHSEVSIALRILFMQGDIMICRRQGFQKTFDIPERVLPPEADTRMPTRREYLSYLIDRDIRAHGLVRPNEVGYLIKNTSKELGQLLKEMVAEGQLVPVDVEGLESTRYYTKAENLDALPKIELHHKLHILSPFDNLIIQRKRTEELLGFSYILECYVTAAKRKVGYFSLPLLLGTRFIGQLDLKAERKKKTLWVKNLIWEDHIESPADHLPELQKSLRDFARFNDCDQIKVESGIKRRLGAEVWRALEGK